ncbi:MAG: tetratricopeptide repeat protein [Rhizonema sp. PD38]|nr:tetratricopeptide repeat protein [Rhizonema sp. PD38]
MPMIQPKIERLLKDKIGLAASTIGSNTIARSVEKRRLACGLPDLQTYLQRVQTSTQELEELIELVVVPETWFFRDRKPFTFLEHYIKSEWLPSRSAGILRLLSVPCSTGEEPYSIAMLLLNAGLTPDKFRIDAVDISKKALLKSSNAVYSKNSFRGEKLPNQERYFQQTAEGYELSQLVRNTVNFMHGNLLEPSFLNNKKYDIIFCRNLLIYFDSFTSSQAIDVLDRLLSPQGLLFVGSAETGTIPTNRFVSVRYPFSFAYQKVAVPTVKVQQLPPTKRKEISQPINNSSVTKSSAAISNLQTAKELADRGQLDEAAQLCKTYLDHHPTSEKAYFLWGKVYQAKGENAQAEQCFQKAIYLEPNYREALIHLTQLKEQRGDRAGAAVLHQRIQRLQNLDNIKS